MHSVSARQFREHEITGPATAGLDEIVSYIARGNPSLEPEKDSFDYWSMSKVEQMESELRKLSQAELRQIREWLDNVIEDELEFTPEFENSIQQAERDKASGKSARVREPEHD
jgi:hypothetical protein